MKDESLDNAQLFNELQQVKRELASSYETAVEALLHALDLRDRDTAGRTQRVAEMCDELAARGIGDEDHAALWRWIAQDWD